MRRFAVGFACACIGATALLGGCYTPPTQTEMKAFDYGPRPENHEQLIRDYLKVRLTDPVNAIVEFRAGPNQLYQPQISLRDRRWGWGVCVWINDKNTRGAYDGFYPMVFFIREGKIVAVNGGEQDNIIGARYARAGCNELGAPFTAR